MVLFSSGAVSVARGRSLRPRRGHLQRNRLCDVHPCGPGPAYAGPPTPGFRSNPSNTIRCRWPRGGRDGTARSRPPRFAAAFFPASASECPEDGWFFSLRVRYRLRGADPCGLDEATYNGIGCATSIPAASVPRTRDHLHRALDRARGQIPRCPWFGAMGRCSAEEFLCEVKPRHASLPSQASLAPDVRHLCHDSHRRATKAARFGGGRRRSTF